MRSRYQVCFNCGFLDDKPKDRLTQCPECSEKSLYPVAKLQATIRVSVSTRYPTEKEPVEPTDTRVKSPGLVPKKY